MSKPINESLTYSLRLYSVSETSRMNKNAWKLLDLRKLGRPSENWKIGRPSENVKVILLARKGRNRYRRNLVDIGES